MVTNASVRFSPDYASARQEFLGAASAAGASLSSFAIDASGAMGEELAIDVAYLGPTTPSVMVGISSGLHGAEGYAGSAIQSFLLREGLDRLCDPSRIGLLLVHAVNPFGFSHGRRVNENNVDLNRNFLRHPEDHVPNPHYDRLGDLINPRDLDEEGDLALSAAMAEFVQEHGIEELHGVLSRGQHAHPSGLQYGGARAEQSNLLVRSIWREVCQVQRLLWIDLHTGLGSYGVVRIIPLIETAPNDANVELSLWASPHADLGIRGDLASGLRSESAETSDLAFYTLEFGTYGTHRLLAALRRENWLHHHGDAASSLAKAIKGELLEVFCPHDPAWRANVLVDGVRAVHALIKRNRFS